MADGKVVTGFSFPRVAKYKNTAGVISYEDGMALARGVSVSDGVEASGIVKFFANNMLAEVGNKKFTGGSIDLEIDGLKKGARKLIMGLPAESTVTIDSETVSYQKYNKNQSIPYVGVGFVIQTMEDGVTKYTAVVFRKGMFNIDPLNATTQGEEIEFQTTTLTFDIMRDDSSDHDWKYMAEDLATEDLAVAVIDHFLDISA